ncbi:MAG: hypothetical protein RM022_001930 [Nostoc sp. EfeVER01]
MTILNARNLSLEEIQRLFGFQEQYSDLLKALMIKTIYKPR